MTKILFLCSLYLGIGEVVVQGELQLTQLLLLLLLFLPLLLHFTFLQNKSPDDFEIQQED